MQNFLNFFELYMAVLSQICYTLQIFANTALTIAILYTKGYSKTKYELSHNVT